MSEEKINPYSSPKIQKEIEIYELKGKLTYTLTRLLKNDRENIDPLLGEWVTPDTLLVSIEKINKLTLKWKELEEKIDG